MSAVINTTTTKPTPTFKEMGFDVPLPQLEAMRKEFVDQSYGSDGFFEGQRTLLRFPGIHMYLTLRFQSGIEKPYHYNNEVDSLVVPSSWVQSPDLLRFTLAVFGWCVKRSLKMVDTLDGTLDGKGDLSLELTVLGARHTLAEDFFRTLAEEMVKQGNPLGQRMLDAFDATA